MGMGAVNFATGVYSSTTKNVMIAHAGFMLLAWGILAPLGVLTARYGKQLYPEWKAPWAPFWFSGHRAIQGLALLCSFIGMALALAMVWGGAHFANAHEALGLAVFIIGCLQPLNACIRPHPAPHGAAPAFARRAWEFVHKNTGRSLLILGAANVFLGIQLYGAGISAIVLYSIWIGALVGVAAWREWKGKAASSAAALLTAPPSTAQKD